MDVNSKIKIGIIGTGHMGQYHVNIACGLNHVYDVVGFYDNSPERCEEISQKYNIKSFPDPESLIMEADAVVIAVPTVHHYEIAKKALEQKKHVLVEKPMTESVEEARDLVDRASRLDLIFQVGHVERFNGAVLELGKIVDRPYLIECRRLAPYDPRISDVGVVLDLMIHDLDIVINLIDEQPIHVSARGCRVFGNHEDIAVATVQFSNGCIANLNASRATQSKIRTLTISQEKAYLLLNFSTQDIDIHRQASSAFLMTPEELKYRQESFVEKIFVHKDNPLRQEHLHFIECIRGEQQPIVSGELDIRTLEVANEIVKQIESNYV